MKLEEFKIYADEQKNKITDDEFKLFLNENNIKYAGEEFVKFSSDPYIICIVLEDCIVGCIFTIELKNKKHQHILSYYVENKEDDIELVLDTFPRMIQMNYNIIRILNNISNLFLNYKYRKCINNEKNEK